MLLPIGYKLSIMEVKDLQTSFSSKQNKRKKRERKELKSKAICFFFALSLEMTKSLWVVLGPMGLCAT